jgi:predicted Zn-dependent protease
MSNEPVTNTAAPDKRDGHFGGSSYDASLLRELLAVIHRDGGHYVAEHGIEKAADDAQTKVIAWLARDDAAGVQEVPRG